MNKYVSHSAVAVAALTITAAMAVGSDEAPGSATERPNVLLMIADDMSWKDWGVYGNKFAKTPHIDKVMEKLEKAGLTEETILIITSDHGMPWPRGKGSLYDMGTRVPLIVRWPKRIKPGRVVDDFVNFIDLAPTILEVAGLAASKQMTGKGLTKILMSDRSGTIESRRDRTHFALEAHHTVGPYQAWLGYV